jgi:hypothetical protein
LARGAAVDADPRLLRRHQLAQPPLGADADLGGIDLHLPVLRLPGVDADGIGVGDDLHHVVDGLGAATARHATS